MLYRYSSHKLKKCNAKLFSDWYVLYRHDVDTVKKKPSEKPATIPEGPVRQSLVFREMFSGHQDGDVTLPEVNIDDELKELDDDFGDFDETGVEDVEVDLKGDYNLCVRYPFEDALW